MANTTLKSLSYRRFDDLINEVYADLPGLTREGMVEPAQLIKIAQKINWELGLKIFGTKETILDIEHNRAKLPADFNTLNIALLCHHHTVCERGRFSGLHSEDVAIPLPPPNLTTCPCWTLEVNSPSYIKYVECDGTNKSVLYQSGTYKLCAASITPGQTYTYTTASFCYNDQNTGQFTCDLPDNCSCDVPVVDTCVAIDADPWHQNRVYTICNDRMEVHVIEYQYNEVREYREFEQITMVPSKEATSFCINTSFHNCRHQGNIRDGYLHLPTYAHGKLYICYLGAMQDDEGNLLVLDHPKINEWYEWALKERIYTNLYIGGEPDMERRLQLIQNETKRARAESLSIVATPDFYELKKVIENNRKAMYAKYLHPFSKLYGNNPWSINTSSI